ncbi:clpC [Symbiodinium sp. CCMP2456]|nr:clpC [Symbiodinium sp. CCMP2456]
MAALEAADPAILARGHGLSISSFRVPGHLQATRRAGWQEVPAPGDARGQAGEMPMGRSRSRQTQLGAATLVGASTFLVGRRRQRLRRLSRRVFDRFRQDAITAIYSAQEEALRRSHGVVSTELIIFGIFSEEQKGANLIAKTALVRKGVTREALKRFIATSPKPVSDTPGSGSLPFSENARLLFDAANDCSVGNTEVGCEQLLLALGDDRLAQSGGAKMLAGLGLSGSALREAVSEAASAPGAPERQLAAVGADESSESDMTLDEVATDLTQMALDGLLDPVVGRQEEMDRIIQILLRKRKNNACLVGPPGVGKTAVVEGVKRGTGHDKVPNRLKGKQVYSLDLGQLVELSSAGNSAIVCAC